MSNDNLPSVEHNMRYTKVMLSCLLLAAALAVIATPATAEDSSEPGYLLYTRRNPQTPQRIEPEVETLVRSPFYALEPIVLLLPSWRSNNSAEQQSKLATALLEREACNVFALDSTESQTESQLVNSASNVIVQLHQQFDVPLAKQQLVGFAEGAHLAGAVAEQVQQLLGEQFSHIIALDPTGDSVELAHQLSAQDAAYVEVLHTNGNGLGTMTQLGDVDYYPNGGEEQPGCSSDACAHERALDLAVEMWSPANDFVSALCGSVDSMSAQNCRWSSQRMGIVATGGNTQRAAGIYFLETKSQAPFGRGAYYIGFL
ncbi:phospholipase A1 2 [Drosophila nasuta]|uniref:phospholipase A1 2 n=1 Tax=Drosophila nasuta TaxID=42062 RepID=UPI00295EB6EA|nr:phospholipase A1 2 [Drosophila nasuta]